MKALGLKVEVLGLGVDPPCRTSKISPTVSFSVVVVTASVVVVVVTSVGTVGTNFEDDLVGENLVLDLV